MTPTPCPIELTSSDPAEELAYRYERFSDQRSLFLLAAGLLTVTLLALLAIAPIVDDGGGFSPASLREWATILPLSLTLAGVWKAHSTKGLETWEMAWALTWVVASIWSRMESPNGYITPRTTAELTHSLCEPCFDVAMLEVE